MTYLVDTNMILYHVRGNTHVDEYIQKYGLFREENTFILIVTIAECLSVAGKNDWGKQKRKTLHALVDSLNVIPIAQRDLVHAYAALDTYSQGKLEPINFTSRNMGKNDLWIAATAHVTHATLVTTDKDFDHLRGRFIQVLYLNPLTLRG